MKKLTAILLTLCLLLALTGCGGSTKAEMAYREEVAEAPAAAMDMVMSANGMSGNTNGSTALPEGRKWIITIDMSVETDDLDALRETLDEKINSLGGYVEDQNIHNGSSHSSRRYRNANLTVRIPDENVDKFTDDVAGIANVVSQNLRREDITLRYVSTASRVTALETEEARLLELLAKAETMEDLLEIEARLTDVRYELENYASQLRLYDNQIDYATIYLYIEEVQEYTPVEEPTFLERITNGFTDSLESLAEGTVDVIVWIIASSPYLVVFGAVAAVVILIVKRVKKGKAKKQAAAENNQES